MSVRVLWEGPFFTHHSLAVVNRELVLALAGRSGLDVRIRSNEDLDAAEWSPERGAALRGREGANGFAADVTVRHRWPLDVAPPTSGRWVLIQPWEYGALPRAWHDTMRFGADQIWVPSTFNRTCYVEAGIPESRVHVVPNGVQPVMWEEPSPFPLRTRKRVRFLFVGGAIPRKGIDLLLDAYARTFTRRDDVCLVIKDFGAGSFYRGQSYGPMIRELQRDPGAPEIEYIADDLAPERLRDLYHACQCLVHPYRGEGFGLPIAEAMACGLPVIVPDQGGAADFCTAETAVLLPSRRVPVPRPIARDLDTLGHPWWLEVAGEDLRARMRAVYEDPTVFADIARRGRALVRERFTWAHAADLAAAALLEQGRAAPFHGDADRQYQERMAAGVECWERGELVQAIRCFAVVRQQRADADVTFNLAVALIARGDHRAALGVLEELLKLEGDDQGLAASAAALAALSLLRLGRHPEAVRMVERAVERHPHSDDVRAAHAEISAAAPPPPAAPAAARPRVRWRGPLFNGSGFADEARNFLLGLRESGWDTLSLAPVDPVEDSGVLEPGEFALLRDLCAGRPAADVEIQHVPALETVVPSAPVSVLRTMFETDRLACNWVDVCNQFTEVWVPTEFNRDTFARSGVLREKIRVVPGALDTELYDPARHPALPLASPRGFRFVSVFDWQHRKGWDVLLRSYFEEFAGEPGVTLVIKPTRHHVSGSPAEFIAEFARRHGFRDTPRIEVVDRRLAPAEMISLYLACDAFVLPSRGEGWGRPYMEAMALGLPTIGTRWSGALEFMDDDNSFLIDVDGLEPADAQGLPGFEGHLWARPSVASTRALMRQVFADPAAARRRGARARQEITARFSRSAVAAVLAAELTRIGAQA